MASKTVTISPAGAQSAGCTATCNSYYQGVKPPQYSGDVTEEYTNYQVIATGVGNWRPKTIKVSHFYTYSDGTTGTETISYRSSNYGEPNPWRFPAVESFNDWENPFEYHETDPGSTTAVRTVDDTITGIEVVFDESTPPTTLYTIVTTASPAGGGTTTGGGTYSSGAIVNLTATANTDYRFLRWELNGATVSTNASYAITVSGNATYTAVFEAAITIAAVALFRGTVSIDNGTPSAAARGVFHPGDVITLHAYPENTDLIYFDRWILGTDWQHAPGIPGAGAHYQLTVGSASQTYGAVFDYYAKYVIHATTIGPGRNGATISIDGGAPTTSFIAAKKISRVSSDLTATTIGEVDQNRFVKWVKGTEVEPTYPYDDAQTISTVPNFTFTASNPQANDNIYLYAVYDVFKSVTLSVSPNGTGTAAASRPPDSGDSWYLEESSLTITATPAAGYKFVKWTYRFYGTDYEFSRSATFTWRLDGNTTMGRLASYDITAHFEWDGTNLLVNSSNLDSPVKLVYDPATNKLVADY